MTIVDRRTSCIVGWAVAAERNEMRLQHLVDAAPQAAFSFSDRFPPYRYLVYTPGLHTPMPDKSETYRVEGVNTVLRHYLARLARKSRCFSRCMDALRRAVKLFVFSWNRRQLYRSRFPRYPAHLIDFVYP
ncbi:MAG: IS1 family transposase [Anaerolineae bacterium]|nr:IS1 family transposase [Anaerolineae bacterium]